MRRVALAATVVFALIGCERAESEPERPVRRPVDSSAAVVTRPPAIAAATLSPLDSLRASLERLVGGGSNPRTGAASAWFTEGTAGVLRSVAIDSAGHAVVDFHDLRAILPNAASSAGSEALLADLHAAVFAVPRIASVEYRMEGSCELFGEWLQYGMCLTFSREEQGWR